MLRSVPEPKAKKQFEKDPAEAENRRIRGGADHVPVSAIMTRDVITISPDTSIETATTVMFENGIARLPVLDGEGKLVGILSYADLANQAAVEGDTYEQPNPRMPLRRGVAYQSPDLHLEAPVALVADRMTRHLFTVNETDPIVRAAELMSVHHIHGLPVLGKNGKLVGVVSSLDVLGWVAGLT